MRGSDLIQGGVATQTKVDLIKSHPKRPYKERESLYKDYLTHGQQLNKQ